MFKNGQPLIGVKINVLSNPLYGYTLSRNNGIFDIMVNGGGIVSLQLSRARLKTRVISVNALWNQFVHVDPIVMYLNEDKEEETIVKVCDNVFFDNLALRPTVRTSWKEVRSFYYDNAVLLPETGTIRNQVNIMDTNLKLSYTTNQAAGFYSTIYILMTSDLIPENLQQVHLKIEIEGVVNRQIFDAFPNLRYEYSWDRRNAYEQRVFGITFAKGKIFSLKFYKNFI